ncbi:class II aldolase, partial [Aureobasidium melanogenum]
MTTTTTITVDDPLRIRSVAESRDKQQISDALQLLASGGIPCDGIPTIEDAHRKRKWMLEHMAGAFRVFARKGFTEGTAGHISLRDPVQPDTFWINPLGVHFGMLKASDMVQINEEGQVVGGNKVAVNAAGFAIHSAIHKARPDVNAACHCHSPAGKAWSAFGKPLEIINQDSCLLWNNQEVYMQFGGVVLAKEESVRIAKALGPQSRTMILQNHGLLTCGSTVDEAAYLFTMMEKTCEVQIMADAAGHEKKIVGEEEARFTHEVNADPITLYTEFQPDFEFEALETRGARRRLISPNTFPVVLASDQVERHIADLDARNAPGELGPFSVFHVLVPPIEPRLPLTDSLASPPTAYDSPASTRFNEADRSEHADGSFQDIADHGHDNHVTTTGDHAFVADLTSASPSWQPLQSRSQEHADLVPSTTASSSELAVASNPPDLGTWPVPVIQVSDDVKILLSNYMYRVVDTFAIIKSPKNPWKIIHLPRAVQIAGELTLIGSTTTVRLALFNAILAVSSFYMANDPQHLQQIPKWTQLASNFRSRAIVFLNRAINEEVDMIPRPKYKELLAATLTMITVDVASGEAETCSLHLDGCEQIIRHVRKRKSRFSHKARALHRIYFYLRTIHDATRPWTVADASATNESHSSSSSTDSPTAERSSVTSPLRNAEFATSFERGSGLWLDMTESSMPDMTACEFVYGILQSALVLLRRATVALRLDYLANDCDADAADSIEVQEICRSVELEILNWSAQTELGKKAHLFSENEFELVKRQTNAFHHALVIYFAKQYRHLPSLYLANNVLAALQDLEELEQLKTAHRIEASPIFWPAFIAACEARDKQTRQRWRTWYEKAEAYNVNHAMSSGRNFAFETWDHEGANDVANAADDRCRWRVMVESQQLCLMLT